MTMKDIRHIIYLLAFFLAACSDAEEDIPVPDVETCSLTIQLGAEGATETRATVDPNAEDGEFIHSLWVFITDEKGKIEAKFEYTEGDTDTDASVENDETSTSSGGNVLQWMRTVEGIPLGTKTIYAFANMDNVDEMTELLKTEVGSQLTDIDNLVISDPASDVDIVNGSYIPMSKKQTENITGNQTITVELVRLVARVDVTLTNQMTTGATIKPTSFTMKSFANQVALFEKGTANATNNVSYPYDKEQEFNIGSIDKGKSASFFFYINETKEAEMEVTVGTADGNYTGKLNATKILRNNILPLNLFIGDNKLIIEMYLAPIGVYPFEAGVSGDLLNPAEGSTVNIPEGCSFRVRDAADNTYYEIAIKEGTPSGVIAIDDDKTWAHVTALPGQQATITANRMDIPIKTVEIKDIGESYQTQAFSWRAMGCPAQMVLSRPECNEGHK